MATRTFAAAFRVEALDDDAGQWALLWSEYREVRAEAEIYWQNVVRPAEARVDRAFACYVARPGATSRAVKRGLDRLRDEAVPDYALIHEIHAGLVEQACNLESALLVAPAPDDESLLWKLNRLVELGTPGEAARRSLRDDSRRLFG